MSEITVPGVAPKGPIGKAVFWARANLFNSWLNTIITLVIIYGVVRLVPPVIQWAVLDSVWSAPDNSVCRAALGACWAFIGVWYRFILFGRFPYDEQWRPLLVCFIFIALLLMSCDRRFWNSWLMLIWVAGTAVIATLMWGGVLGMTFVETDLWNGLPLTLILAVFGLGFAFPLAILLALGRRSHMPAIRALSVGYIEFIRGVPLITVLFMASVMLPLFLPTGTTINKLLRAEVAFILFSAAYLAEVVRGGLQAVPKGQFEAADALGLSYRQKMQKIVLPQALTIAIPPLVNTFIGAFKDTSLVIVIGLFDLLNTANAALNDPAWRGYYVEAYVMISIIYFVFCFFMSRYSQHLEMSFNKGKRR